LRAQVDNVFYLYEVMRRLNVMVCRDTKNSEFVTLFYGVFDARNRRLTYCNAGHPPALLRRNGVISELSGSSLVLGVSPDEVYEQYTVDLQKDDTILLYTDGLTDGMNFQNEQFGKQRLLEAYARSGDFAEGISNNILWELRKHVGMAKRTDDVTMCVARMT
jgi:sigma-B regulation protein RsbU (phosphoserine phosphatase)